MEDCVFEVEGKKRPPLFIKNKELIGCIISPCSGPKSDFLWWEERQNLPQSARWRGQPACWFWCQDVAETCSWNGCTWLPSASWPPTPPVSLPIPDRAGGSARLRRTLPSENDSVEWQQTPFVTSWVQRGCAVHSPLKMILWNNNKHPLSQAGLKKVVPYTPFWKWFCGTANTLCHKLGWKRHCCAPLWKWFCGTTNTPHHKLGRRNPQFPLLQTVLTVIKFPQTSWNSMAENTTSPKVAKPSKTEKGTFLFLFTT